MHPDARPDAVPGLAVKAPVKLRPVLPRTEIRADAHVDDVRRERNRRPLDGLGLHYPAVVVEYALLLAHDEASAPVRHHDGKKRAVGLERGKARAVAVLHFRDVHPDFAGARRADHPLRQGVAGEEDVLGLMSRLQPQPAGPLGKRPRAFQRIVVPLPEEAQLPSPEIVASCDSREVGMAP